MNHLIRKRKTRLMIQMSPYLFSHLVPDVPCSQRHLLPELQVAPFSHGGSQTGSAQVAPVALRGHSHWSGPTHAPPFRHANRHETANTEYINPLNAELNAICHLLALLGAHHIHIRCRTLLEDLRTI